MSEHTPWGPRPGESNRRYKERLNNDRTNSKGELTREQLLVARAANAAEHPESAAAQMLAGGPAARREMEFAARQAALAAEREAQREAAFARIAAAANLATDAAAPAPPPSPSPVDDVSLAAMTAAATIQAAAIDARDAANYGDSGAAWYKVGKALGGLADRVV